MQTKRAELDLDAANRRTGLGMDNVLAAAARIAGLAAVLRGGVGLYEQVARPSLRRTKPRRTVLEIPYRAPAKRAAQFLATRPLAASDTQETPWPVLRPRPAPVAGARPGLPDKGPLPAPLASGGSPSKKAQGGPGMSMLYEQRPPANPWDNHQPDPKIWGDATRDAGRMDQVRRLSYLAQQWRDKGRPQWQQQQAAAAHPDPNPMLRRPGEAFQPGEYRAMHPTGGMDSAPGRPGLYGASAAAGQQELRQTNPHLSQQNPTSQAHFDGPARRGFMATQKPLSPELAQRFSAPGGSMPFAGGINPSPAARGTGAVAGGLGGKGPGFLAGGQQRFGNIGRQRRQGLISGGVGQDLATGPASGSKINTPFQSGTPLKAGEAPAEPSGLASTLVNLLGLKHVPGEGWLRDWVAPRGATSLLGMPGVAAAGVPLLAGAAYAGWKPVDSAFRWLRRSEDEDEVDEAKGRYEGLLRQQAMGKAGGAATGLDAVYEKHAASGLWDLADTLLALSAAVPATAAGVWSFNRARDGSSTKVLDAALRQRRRAQMASGIHPYLLKPVPIPAGRDAGDGEPGEGPGERKARRLALPAIAG